MVELSGWGGLGLREELIAKELKTGVSEAAAEDNRRSPLLMSSYQTCLGNNHKSLSTVGGPE